MNHNLDSTLPRNTSKIQAMIFGTRSLPWRTMKSGSYFRELLKTIPLAELDRHTCDCVTHAIGYQGMKSPNIYTNGHLFNFSKESRINTLSRLANVLTASKFPYIFCSYKPERTKTIRCCKSEQLADAYSKELTLRTALSNHKLFSN